MRLFSIDFGCQNSVFKISTDKNHEEMSENKGGDQS